MKSHLIIEPNTKPEKTRTGLYLDRELHEEVKAIAQRSGTSYNEAISTLVKKGIESLTK